MIRYDEALSLVLGEAAPLPAEPVPPEAALGRFCARDVRSPVALPGFPNSAMDGFALATGGRALEPGSRWRVAGSVAAGDAPVEDGAVGGGSGSEGAPGVAWEIMTGAPVPAGLDAVVPVEHVRVERERGGRPALVRVEAPIEPGQNVRPAGKDFRRDDPVLAAGRRIGPAELMALSALGIVEVPVVRTPRAWILCTGPELVDDPTRELEPGQIRNSNGPWLSSYLRRRGVAVAANRTMRDEVAPFVDELGRAQDEGAELVVSTGAVSMGRHDFVPEALERVGARILFHRVAIRPGKPHLAAVLPGGGLFFGLPGNPISAVVGSRFFIEPFVAALRGGAPEVPWRLPLAADVPKRPDLRFFMRAVVEQGRAVRVLPGQQSFRIAPLLDARVWAVLPEGPDRVAAGTEVDVHGLYGPPPWTEDG